jgi:hypothetical protein
MELCLKSKGTGTLRGSNRTRGPSLWSRIVCSEWTRAGPQSGIPTSLDLGNEPFREASKQTSWFIPPGPGPPYSDSGHGGALAGSTNFVASLAPGVQGLQSTSWPMFSLSMLNRTRGATRQAEEGERAK